MSSSRIRRADARFLLSEAPRHHQEPSDIAITTPGGVGEAISPGVSAIIIEGGGVTRRLHAAGYHVSKHLALPSVESPDVFVPFDDGATARHALLVQAAPPTTTKRVRNAAVAALISRGVAPPRLPCLTVGQREKGQPFLLRAAADLLEPSSIRGFFLITGAADVLSRCAFMVFTGEATAPTHVVKFARVPSYHDPFDRDERGLMVAASAGAAVARHAPTLTGRFEVAGLHASVESAASGRRVLAVLAGCRRRDDALRVVDRVAETLLEIARATRQPAASLRAERRRLRDDVLPAWSPDVPADLVDAVGGVPGVLCHHDAGTWNIMIGDDDVTLLDWESARPTGLPLWDLVYFLAGALALVDGVDATGIDDYQRRLFEGTAPSSSVLFAWTRRAVEVLQVPAESVGPIVTLCWLHHGLSARARAAAVEQTGAGSGTPSVPEGRFAQTWLQTPSLGATWDRWRNA